ncbi:MAG TPA: c-type cytochrome [Gaiellaceae bacterium]|nr:c-type cytochrome [Gaiellaceae bacterium]
MRRLLGLALVPLVAACGSGGHATSSAREALASQVGQNIPRWIEDEHLPAAAKPGARVFATAGCTACHTYDGAGGTNLGAPDLTAIGRRHRGIRFRIAQLKCPSCVNSGSPMPPFGSLGRKRLRELAIFLEASKGRR